VAGDADDHRLRVAVDAHEEASAGADERLGVLHAGRHLREVEPRGELSVPSDDRDR
jgi:hypothetical protein